MIPPIWSPLPRKQRAVIRLAAMALVSIVISAAGWFVVDRFAPAQDVPWKPLDLALPPGLATSAKLNDLKRRPEACFTRLAEMGVEVTRLARPSPRPECAIPAALTLDRSLVAYSPTLSMSCPLAAALYVWERHVVLPEAERLLGSRVVKIETFGAWSCRRVNGAKEGRWSEHAQGAAIDISGFRLEDGRRITIKADFRDPGPEGTFLRNVRKQGCSVFQTVLGPDYNALHADHLHLDMGTWRTCR